MLGLTDGETFMELDPRDLSVEISADKLEVGIKIVNKDILSSITSDVLMGALTAKGVSTGIKQEAVDGIANNPVANVLIIVATGTNPTPGTDEKIEYKFPTEGEVVIEEDEETGSIDFRKISNFNNFNEGDVLASRTPATEGTDGINVIGSVLPAKAGKTAVLRIGKGAEINEEDNTVVASVAGHGCIVNDRICVLNTVEIPAHVDYSIGNIDFIGNLKIRGGIKPGFVVEARGDIEIADNVEQANIVCGGNLTVQGIIFGHEDCKITVGGNAELHAIDQAILEVQGDLVVSGYIRHCHVKAGSSIDLQGAKSSIVGGEVATLTRIKSPFVGNHMATLTKLSVGVNPFASEEMQQLQTNHDALETKLQQVLNGITGLRNKMVVAGKAGSKMQPMMDKLSQAENQLKPAIAQMATRIQELQATTMNYREAKISISEMVYPGVVINFRNKLQYKTMDEAQRLTYFEENAEIRTGPL